MYSLLALFAIIPLIFSHFFGVFGADFIISNGIWNFESLKMQIFLVLIIIATVEMIWTRGESMRISLEKNWLIILWSIWALLLLGTLFYPYVDMRDLLFGIWEKQHGLLFPVALIWLWYLISLLAENERKNIIYTLIGWGIFIALVSIIEVVFRYNIFTGLTYLTTGSWWDIRATATLWNPNYVAGYLLMILPLILGSIERGKKYFLFLIVFLGILMTKSIIGIVLMSWYTLWSILTRFFSKKWVIGSLILMLLLISASYGLSYESTKWLSLISRFVLMKHSMIGSLDSVASVFFWHGPYGIVQIFSWVRSPEIDRYFPTESIIDSSHNIFIDIFTCYGVFWVAGFLWLLISRWRYLGSHLRTGIILGLTFLSLNVLVISHMILLVLLLSRNSLNENNSQ